jgi:4-alpha-glucanotransferase
MLSERSSGILLHPTSLPSRGGIGDFGPAAYQFVDWLSAAKQTLWQVLPLQPIGMGNSPYSCTSAFAGNVLLISLERLAERGLLDHSSVDELPRGKSPVDFENVQTRKIPLLHRAAANFLLSARDDARARYDSFCRDNDWWLEDYALFSVLRERFGAQPWSTWPREIARRDPDAITQLRSELHEQLEVERFLQFAFFEQWGALRSYCANRGIRIIGDVSIFVSYDSADVWINPGLFRLKKDLSPAVVSGVPPDAFSETGQRWGNPLYDWEALRARGYDWWIGRMRWATETSDIIRIDHFRGFEAFWEILADDPTAVNGHWVKGPNKDLFEALRGALGKLPFIAEDLGYITREVHELRKALNFPGMKILQFGFGNKGAHVYLPHNYEADSVVYTGTHDNNTVVGWWNSTATEKEKKFVSTYLEIGDDGVHWAFIRAALTSVANLAVVPVQDVLGLGSEARMNVPSEADGSWTWRLQDGALTPQLADKMAALVEVTDRDDCVKLPSLDRQQSDREAGENFAA